MAIRVGYDHARDIRDCVFSNLVIHDANRGLGVFVRGAGSVENLIFSDIVLRTRLLTGHWWGKAEPVHVSAVLFAPGVETPGRIRNVTFARLRVEGEHGMILWGSPDSVIEDVTLDDVRLRVRRGPNSDTWGGNVDMRLTRDPKLAVFKRDLPALLARHTDRLTVRNLAVDWADDVPSFFTHAIEAESFRELVVDGFRGRQAQKTGSAIRLAGGEDAVVRDSRAAAGTDTFVEATEVTGRTVFDGNDVRAARQPVVPTTFARPGGPETRSRPRRPEPVDSPAHEGGPTMRTRTFGRTGVSVSEIGFGAWAIGGSWGEQKEEDSTAALHRALDLGCNFIDTAAGYGNGRSERIIGKVLKERKERVFVATKTPPSPGPWPPTPYCRVEERYSESYLRANVEERLRELGTERIDLLQLHTWTRAWNRDPRPFETLRKLQAEGKIRFIGLSTPEHDQNSVIDLMRGGWLDAVQVIYNVFEQEPAAELLPVARETNVGVIVRVVFDEGVLAGRYTKDTRFGEGDFRRSYFAGDRLERAVARVEKVRGEIEGSGLTLPQAAIQFALAHPAVSTVIPGIRSVAQAEANCAVSDLPPMPDDARPAPAQARLAARVLVRREVGPGRPTPSRAPRL